MSGDGDKRREAESRLRPGRESVGLGPCSPRGAPRPAWHLPAPAQAPGSPGPARRAKVAAKTAPPLARRRRLRLGAAGRGGAAGPFVRARARRRLRPSHLGRVAGARRRPGPRPPASSSRSPTDGLDGPFSLFSPPSPGPAGRGAWTLGAPGNG